MGHGRDTDRTGGRAVGGTPTGAGETPALPFLERGRATGSLTTTVPRTGLGLRVYSVFNPWLRIVSIAGAARGHRRRFGTAQVQIADCKQAGENWA